MVASKIQMPGSLQTHPAERAAFQQLSQSKYHWGRGGGRKRRKGREITAFIGLIAAVDRVLAPESARSLQETGGGSNDISESFVHWKAISHFQKKNISGFAKDYATGVLIFKKRKRKKPSRSDLQSTFQVCKAFCTYYESVG